MNKKIKKKALSYNIIIMLILGVIFLIVFLNILNNYNSKADYESSKLQCFQTFKNIPKQPELFFSTINGKYLLGKTLSENCASTKYSIENKNLNNAVTAIMDCYYKTNKLNNIFPASQSEPRTICMVCGFIKTDQKIDNFNEKLIKKLKDKKKELTTSKVLSQNLNEGFLFNSEFLPKTFDVNDEIIITYFTAKLKKKYTGESKNNLNTEFGKSNSENYENDISSLFWKKINNYVNFFINHFTDIKAENIVSGISLYKIQLKDIKKSLDNTEKAKLYSKNSFVNCNEFYASKKENEYN